MSARSDEQREHDLGAIGAFRYPGELIDEQQMGTRPRGLVGPGAGVSSRCVP
jgi:hypothetical protein